MAGSGGWHCHSLLCTVLRWIVSTFSVEKVLPQMVQGHGVVAAGPSRSRPPIGRSRPLRSSRRSRSQRKSPPAVGLPLRRGGERDLDRRGERRPAGGERPRARSKREGGDEDLPRSLRPAAGCLAGRDPSSRPDLQMWGISSPCRSPRAGGRESARRPGSGGSSPSSPSRQDPYCDIDHTRGGVVAACCGYS